MQKATVADSIYIFDNSPCDERWMMKLQHLQTIQTSHCHRMSKIWQHDMPQHSAILRSPPHTRPWRPRRQTGCLPNRFLWRASLSSAPRPRPGGSDRSRLAFCSWFYRQNLITEIPQTIDIQVRNVESLWFKTWKNNPEIHGFIQHLHTVYDIQLDWEYLTTQLDPRWTIKLQHLQHGQTSHCQRISKTWHHDMPQHSAILRSPSHTPGLGALGTCTPALFSPHCLDRFWWCHLLLLLFAVAVVVAVVLKTGGTYFYRSYSSIYRSIFAIIVA